MTRARQSMRRLARLPLFEQLLYRLPIAVTEIHVFPYCSGGPSYPVCPRCGATMERVWMACCSRCGQKLDWRRYSYARVVFMEPGDHTVFLQNSIRSC